MALPETIRVKISSEAAGSISITPVVVRELPARELIETLLGAVGKDNARIRELLRRGSFVSGASRFRWEGWEADAASVDLLLATFPDADPSRTFDAATCIRAVLKGVNLRLDLPREVANERRLFRKRSFWDALMEVAADAAPRYVAYSYKDRADHFALELSADHAARLSESAPALRYSSLETQIRRTRLEALDLYVERPR